MTLNLAYIKQLFKQIATQNNLNWDVRNEYFALLNNDRIEISFGTDPREEGISIALTNLKEHSFYYDHTIRERHGITTAADALPDNDRALLPGLTPQERTVLYFRHTLERFCQRALQGDFSELGKGTPY